MLPWQYHMLLGNSLLYNAATHVIHPLLANVFFLLQFMWFNLLYDSYSFRAEEHLPNTLRQALIYKVVLKPCKYFAFLLKSLIFVNNTGKSESDFSL